MPHHIPISGIGDILASLPALVGYAPEEAIVVLLHTDQHLHTVALLDTDSAPSFAHVSQLALREGSAMAIVVTVTAASDSATATAAAATARALASVAASVTSVHVPGLTAGAIWTDLGTGDTGTLPDPRETPYALRLLLRTGQGAVPTQTELRDRYAPGTPVGTAAAERAAERDRDGFARSTVNAVVLAAHGGQPLAGGELTARLAVLLARQSWHTFAVTAAGFTTSHHAAHTLFASAARHMRGTARMECLLLAGIFAYLGNELAPSASALAAARETMRESGLPENEFLDCMSLLVFSGSTPEQRPIAEIVADAALEAARRLGVALPDWHGPEEHHGNGSASR